MKKLFNGNFLFILAISLITLIGLGVLSYYLFDSDDDKFIKSGYVLNPLSEKVERYFFNEDTGYRVNLSSMVEFKDIDNRDVKVLQDSFLHYSDGGMSFLKNGAILDLDSVHGSDAVKLYNITNKSLIEKDGDSYLIRSSKGNINLKNFIGRINDNKYIVTGKLSIKIPGNPNRIDGEYFEIVYIEEGVINIENKDVKYQVTADGTYIYAGNLVIDLGNKKITSNDKDVMSITAITIDGNDNVEIIPVAEDNSKSTGGGNGGTGGNGSGSGSGSGTGGNGSGNGGGNGGTTNPDGTITKDIVVSLSKASIGSTNVDVTFDIINAQEDDKFILKVTNLESGITIDKVEEVVSGKENRINLLSPKTKYLFTVINERDLGKYFQKIFETNDFGIRLEKSYATDDTLAYKITVDEGTEITNAKLTLYKFNEDTKKNEIVTTTYYDSATGEEKTVQKVTKLSSLKGNIEGVHEVIYDGLDSNTIYTAVLDEFSVASSNFKDIYNITLTAMTLKRMPVFSNMKAVKDAGSGSFKLSLGNIEDKDNAIIDYTYMIYENSDLSKTAISPITKSNASPIEVKFGDGDDQLRNDTNYFYKVIIQYFDNEKYIEYITTDSINFLMGSDPYITVVPNNDLISYDRIGATIYLTDNSCLVSMPGREKCSGASTTVVEVMKINAVTGEKTPVFTKLVDFTVNEAEIKYELSLDGLLEGTTYSVSVKAILNDKGSSDRIEILHADESVKNITTKTLSAFLVDWEDKGSKADHIVNLQTKFVPEEGSGSLSPDESARNIRKVIVKLYNGNQVEDIQMQEPIAIKNFYNTEEFNIKENFYDKGYVITTDGTFGLDKDMLKSLSSDGKLNEYYTITIEAYYDTNENNVVRLTNDVIAYQISPALLVDDLEEAKIWVKEITNANKVFNKLNNTGTVIGYTITTKYDRDGIIANNFEIGNSNLYVYNSRNEKVKFYVMNEDNELVLVDKYVINVKDTPSYDVKIYMGYGTEYENDDKTMSRGNEYYIGYDIEAVSDDGTDTVFEGAKEKVTTKKENPSIKMYVSKTTADTITYRYGINDPDHALYKDGDKYAFYYVVGDGDEKRLDITKSSELTEDFKLDLISKKDISYDYKGTFSITGLSNGDIYKLYYKKNDTKTNNFENDIVVYSEEGDKLFDGYYNAMDEKYNFRYVIVRSITGESKENKVTIKILATDEILERIVAYRVKFSVDNGSKIYERELWKLNECSEFSSAELEQYENKNRCFSVDYADLKKQGMISKNIKVSISALYDNGLMGFDYNVGSDGDYNYMIFQNNNTTEPGKYVVYSKGGELTLFSEGLNVPKGYYQYKFDKLTTYTAGDKGNYYDGEINKYNKPLPVNNLTSKGYESSNGVLNPKMIAISDMKTDNDTFKFDSITPKVMVKSKTSLINGAVMNLTLSGVDLDEVKNEDGDYYLYIDVRDSLSYSARPILKVKIDKNNPNSTIEAVIDGVSPGGRYNFKVSAYLRSNGGYKLTQLFDASYEDKDVLTVYYFNSLTASDIFHTYELSYRPYKDGNYGDRVITSKLNLIAYNGYKFNYDIGYLLCEVDSECETDDDSSYLLSGKILAKDLKTSVLDEKIVDSEKLEYGKEYKFLVYAYYSYYKGGTEQETAEVLLNDNTSASLKKLSEPTFMINRSAAYENGIHLFNIDITVNDVDRTLVNGKYKIKLLDANNEIISGSDSKIKMQIMVDEEYQDVAGNYEDTEFDALTINERIRFVNLDENTKYRIVVYSKAFLNNYDKDIPVSERVKDVEKGHTIYSTNMYGVAFGNDILYSPTAKSIVVTFLGGSSFENVKELSYTIGLWDSDQSVSTISGTYRLDDGTKSFEYFKDSSEWKFIIDPEEMDNQLGQTYNVALSVVVRDPVTLEDVRLDDRDNPAFSARVQYVKDEQNSD